MANSNCYKRLLGGFATSRGSTLVVHRLVCSSTVEDGFSRVAQKEDTNNRIAPDAIEGDDNGIVWKFKRRTLEALFGAAGVGVTPPIFGDNGIKKEDEETTAGDKVFGRFVVSQCRRGALIHVAQCPIF